MAIRTCIAVINEKGGTAKSTTSVNLSAALGEMGQRILLVDLDGQAASSRWVGVEEDNRLADAMTKGIKLKPIPNVLPNVSLVPASGRLDSIAHDLRPTQGGQMRKILNELADDFDYILIDCPPSLGNRLIANGMLAATHVIVPVETSILALDGLKILLTTLEDIREGFGHNLVLAGVLACRYDYRTRLSRLVLEELRRALPGKVFNTVIRENVRMRECPASGQSILTFAPDSTAAADYRALAAELLAPPQAWRQSAELATGQNSVENLRSNTSDKLLDGQRRAAPFAQEVADNELESRHEQVPVREEVPVQEVNTVQVQEPSPVQEPAPVREPVPVQEPSFVQEPEPIPEPARTPEPAVCLEAEHPSAIEISTDGNEPSAPAFDPVAAADPLPVRPAVTVAPAASAPVDEPVLSHQHAANNTDALAKWLDQLASAEKRIKSQESDDVDLPADESVAAIASRVAHIPVPPPPVVAPPPVMEPVAVVESRPAHIAPPESASHHTPAVAIPEAKAATVADTTIPNMVPEPVHRAPVPPPNPAAVAAVAAILTPPEPTIAPVLIHTVPNMAAILSGSAAPDDDTMADATPKTVITGATPKSESPAELSMMEILAGMTAPTPAPKVSPAMGTALPDLAPVPDTPASSNPTTAPRDTTEAASAPVAEISAVMPQPAGKPAAGSGENGDNFPALRAYLKQMQKDGKLPAKGTPQTTSEPRKSGGNSGGGGGGGGLRSLFRKVVGPK